MRIHLFFWAVKLQIATVMQSSSEKLTPASSATSNPSSSTSLSAPVVDIPSLFSTYSPNSSSNSSRNTKIYVPHILPLTSFFVTCPHCKTNMHTLTRYRSGKLVRVSMIVLASVCLIPCLPLPLFFKSIKDVEHTCSECHKVIGTAFRM